jgi:hypothetical protein
MTLKEITLDDGIDLCGVKQRHIEQAFRSFDRLVRGGVIQRRVPTGRKRTRRVWGMRRPYFTLMIAAGGRLMPH